MSKSSAKKKKTAAVSGAGKNSVVSSNEQRREVPTNDAANAGKIEKHRNVGYGIASVVSLITFIVYLSSLRNEFVMWDDGQYVYENPHIHSFDTAFFRWAFTEFHAANWHPLTWASHTLDYVVWGLNPLGHHLTNNILHAVNTFVVVILAMTLLEAWKGKTDKSGQQFFLNRQTVLIAGGMTGLLFGLHPVHVESVAWVAERKDLLCALFYLLAIIQYAKYANVTDAGKVQKYSGTRFLNKHYLLVAAFFVLALLSKPMAVSLPVVLLILDWYPFERIRSVKSFLPAFAEKLPLIALSIISSILTVLAQKSGGAIQSIEAVPFSSRVAVAAKSLLVYLWKMALPVNLVPFYPYPENISPFSAGDLLSIILVPGITAACIVMAKRQKLWLSVWAYYVVTLVPVLGIVQVGMQSMADRYTYLPSLSIFLMTGLLCAWGIEKTNFLQKQGLIAKFFSGMAAIFVLACLSFLTFKQVAIWKDSVTLWTYVMEKEPRVAPLAYNNLGLFYQNQNMPGKAEEEFLTALKLKPDFAEGHENLGVFYKNHNMPDKAMEQYLIVTRLQPDNAEAHSNFAAIYKTLNMPDKAIEQYLIATKLHPDNAEAHSNLGVLYQTSNMPDKAEEEFLIAIKLKPDFAKAHYNLGVLYKSINMIDKAKEHYLVALKLKPDLAEAHNNLGSIYLLLNMPDKAEEEYLSALKLKPDFAEAHYNLGFVYYNAGQLEKAQRELAGGLEIKPTNQQAQRLLETIKGQLKAKH